MYKLCSTKHLKLLLTGSLLFTFACQQQPNNQETTSQPDAPPMIPTKDIHSFARPDEAVLKHLYLDLTVNFSSKTLTGQAILDIENKAQADTLYLDTDKLSIQKVTLDKNETPVQFSLGKVVEHLGQPLAIPITPQTKQVTIHYSTSDQAGALQWLSPEQTAGKKHPFLFTQSQAILARSWAPVQDSPGIRFTYTARVKVPKELLALMSADNPTAKNAEGVYTFKMDKPIPAYLLALSVGDLAFESVGPHTGVYAEPVTLPKAVNEFADLEKMLQAAEKIYGEYAWGRYDLLVLPPSFPFGGMENPKLTFATPTILAGDRSLTSLVAHELAHSWSGNLVTNQTWNDFWLNEGFTVYFERRIMEELYGKSYADMLASLGYQDLVQTVEEFGKDSPDTQLKLNLTGRNPDDGVSDIAYEKGFFFLRLLENTLGREKWDTFVKNYFQTYAYQSMNTERFLEYLKKELFSENPEAFEKLNIQEWIYSPGLPLNIPQVTSERFAAVEEAAKKWQSGTAATQLQTNEWSSHEWLRFIRVLPESLSTAQMAELDKAFHFTQSGNSEILAAWLLKAVQANYSPAYPALENFLVNVGRRKFLTPLYQALLKTPEGKERAKAIYAKARPNYHFVATNTLDAMLK
jgi:leukotriene A-4 hydrolase/aminopeptidase